MFLFLPFIIFIVASGLVFYSWFLSNTSSDLPSNLIVYVPLYISTVVSPDPFDTQQLMEQILYNHFAWPVFVSGTDQHPAIRNLISMDIIEESFLGRENSDNLRPVQLPLYSLLQSLKGPFNQFDSLWLIIVLFIDVNDLVFSVSYLVLYVVCFIILVWSYKVTLCAYVTYSNTGNTIGNYFQKGFSRYEGKYFSRYIVFGIYIYKKKKA